MARQLVLLDRVCIRADNVFYYLADDLGTSRVTAEVPSGSTTATLCYDADFYPFGGERHFVDSCDSHYKFTGKERDPESNLDYFGPRYNSSSLGRFMSPDPSSVLALRIVNPQRWNAYAYVLDNPLTYTDPNGRDAIAVNFVREVPLGGHEGIIVVNRNDGSATYARFGPAHPSSPVDNGKVTIKQLQPIQFGSDGLPTDASYKDLAKEVGQIEGEDWTSVRFNYFRTSPLDTQALENWIQQWKRSQAPEYNVTSQNCAAFCIAGLLVSHAINNSGISLIPNHLFTMLSLNSDDNWTFDRKPKNNSEPGARRHRHFHCLMRRDGTCVD